MGIILVFCLSLRLIGLSQSLWLDEAVSANVVKNFNFQQIISSFSPTDFHPPLYYLVLKLWTNVFGYSEIALRMPSVIFSLVTIYLAYLIAGKTCLPAGRWAAILTGFNPLLIYYSQEARMYSLAVMLLTAAIYCLERKKIFYFNLFCFLAFLSFYGSVFLITAMLIYVWIKGGWKKTFGLAVGIILAIALISPLLREQLVNSRAMLIEVRNWSLVLGEMTIRNLLLIPVKFSVGRISFYPKILYWIISGAWTLLVFGAWLWTGIKNRFWVWMFILPLILGMVISAVSPMMQYFRFVYLIPIMVIILSKTKLKKLIAVGFLGFSLVYLVNPKFHREDWKNLAKDLGKEVYMISTVADPVKYYRPEVAIKDIKNPQGKEIQVVPYAEEIHGLDHKAILTKMGYRRIEEKSFRELVLEKWQLGE